MDARNKYRLCTFIAYDETQSMSSGRYRMPRHSQFLRNIHTRALRIKTPGSCSKLAKPCVQMIHIHSKRTMSENSSNPKNVQQRRKSQSIEKWSPKKRLLRVCLSKRII